MAGSEVGALIYEVREKLRRTFSIKVLARGVQLQRGGSKSRQSNLAGRAFVSAMAQSGNMGTG